MELITTLVWNEANTAHIARHNVTKEEVEQVCYGRFVARETYNNRYLIVGLTQARRMIAVVLSFRTTETYFVVTARSASKPERRWYQDEMTIKGGENAA
jgi:uncharacterized protein